MFYFFVFVFSLFQLPAMATSDLSCHGRLTLSSGVPYPTEDLIDMTTLYFIPVNGNTCAVFDGSNWKKVSYLGLSIDVSHLTLGSNYDVFIYNNSEEASLTLEFSARWTNNTTRSEALTVKNGVYVKFLDPSRRYVGTIRTKNSSCSVSVPTSTCTEDSAKRRFIWNLENQRIRKMEIQDFTDSWSGYGADYSVLNNSTANRAEFVVGISQSIDSVEGTLYVETHKSLKPSSSKFPRTNFGLDHTSFPSQGKSGYRKVDENRYELWVKQELFDTGIGYHYIQWLQRGIGTFFGDPSYLTIRFAN